MAGQLPEASDVDRSHLLHEDSRVSTFDLDLGPEGSASCARGRGGDQNDGSGEKGVRLDDYAVALPLLFMSDALRKAKAEDVTPVHVGSP